MVSVRSFCEAHTQQVVRCPKPKRCCRRRRAGAARHGKERRGTAKSGAARSTEWHSTKRGTAQRGTARHGTRHRAARHGAMRCRISSCRRLVQERSAYDGWVARKGWRAALHFRRRNVDTCRVPRRVDMDRVSIDGAIREPPDIECPFTNEPAADLQGGWRRFSCLDKVSLLP